MDLHAFGIGWLVGMVFAAALSRWVTPAPNLVFWLNGVAIAFLVAMR